MAGDPWPYPGLVPAINPCLYTCWPYSAGSVTFGPPICQHCGVTVYNGCHWCPQSWAAENQRRIDEAKALLESRGHTVTPPPEDQP